MACNICKSEKLSSEFPPFNATEVCDHPCLTCLRCLVTYVAKNEACPHPGCNKEVKRSSETICLFQEILADMFTEYDTEYTPQVDSTDGNSFINVTGLTGSSITIAFSSQMTVLDLKQKIQTRLGHTPVKQRLLYKDKEMETYDKNRSLKRLLDYGVEANTAVCLVICLYAIPDNFDHVVFDLFWGFPVEGADYLDASCLLYSGTNFVEVVDYCHRPTTHKALKHSGDIMDRKARRGHHVIDVFLQKIPKQITHLFFTLSAFGSPNISKYRSPSLRFYEASEPNTDLCTTTFTHANYSQAVVMCSMSNARGSWEIFDSGKLSAGNAMNYQHLQTTIKQLISSGY